MCAASVATLEPFSHHEPFPLGLWLALRADPPPLSVALPPTPPPPPPPRESRKKKGENVFLWWHRRVLRVQVPRVPPPPPANRQSVRYYSVESAPPPPPRPSQSEVLVHAPRVLPPGGERHNRTRFLLIHGTYRRVVREGYLRRNYRNNNTIHPYKYVEKVPVAVGRGWAALLSSTPYRG